MIFCFPVIYIGMCFLEDICSDAVRRADSGSDEQCLIVAQWIQGLLIVLPAVFLDAGGAHHAMENSARRYLLSTLVLLMPLAISAVHGYCITGMCGFTTNRQGTVILGRL